MNPVNGYVDRIYGATDELLHVGQDRQVIQMAQWLYTNKTIMAKFVLGVWILRLSCGWKDSTSNQLEMSIKSDAKQIVS